MWDTLSLLVSPEPSATVVSSVGAFCCEVGAAWSSIVRIAPLPSPESCVAVVALSESEVPPPAAKLSLSGRWCPPCTQARGNASGVEAR